MPIDSYPSLFWGYTVIWLLISAYIIYLSRKLSNLERKIKETKNDFSS